MKRSDISDKEVCQAVSEYHNILPPFDIYNPFKFAAVKTPYPYETLALKFKCDEKLAFSACERA